MAAPRAPRRRIRVPREDGAVLADPPLGEVSSIVAENRRLFDSIGDEHRIAGVPFSVLRRCARIEIIAAAVEETERLVGSPVDLPGDIVERPMIATGHQPAPFHPGVWIKNFATAAIAERVGGIGLNVTVDSDTRSSSSIRVPSGDAESPRYTTIPFDDHQPSGPWEEADLVSPEAWEAAPKRLRDQMAEWGAHPLAGQFSSSDSPLSGLAERLSRRRVDVERRWGCDNLEVSMSRVCRTPAFRHFMLDVLRRAESFHIEHNAVLAEYRHRNRIRSSTHPVPALERSDGWTETPFWVWRAGGVRRSPLLVSEQPEHVRLGLRGEEIARLPMDDEAAIAILESLEQEGVRLRTRALTTTLFLRLLACDLFVHGVGGAKYDEMTDELIRRFFGLPVPRFLLLSGTKHLPLAPPNAPGPGELSQRIRNLKRRRRDLHYQAERFLDHGDAGVRRLIDEKQDLIQSQQAAELLAQSLPRRDHRARRPINHRRFEHLQDVNRRLAELASPHAEQTERALAEAERQLAASAVLRGREWAWWLYPEASLRPFLTELEIG